MITLYGIGNCDTIKKTRRWLDQHQHDYQFHDYKKLGCDAELAAIFLARFELDEVINKRGTTWRKLPETVKNSLDSDSAAELMIENHSIIKRPILKIGKQWVLGYDEKKWQALIKES